VSGAAVLRVEWGRYERGTQQRRPGELPVTGCGRLQGTSNRHLEIHSRS